jgi:hypothetical protein
MTKALTIDEGKRLLHSIEREIGEGMETFYHVGRQLARIRDDELYGFDGFETWTAYLKARWDCSTEHARRLIVASEYRAKLPTPPNWCDGKRAEWSEGAVRELTRLETQDDATRLAAKVVQAVEDSEKQAAGNPDVKRLKLTAATVRKFVDEDKGVDRPAQTGEERLPALYEYLSDLTHKTNGVTRKLTTFDGDDWILLRRYHPKVLKHLLAALDRLTDALWEVNNGRGSVGAAGSYRRRRDACATGSAKAT